MSEGPKVTQEMVDDFISEVHYQVMPSGKTMVCELILKNDFSIIGKSSVVSKENFSEDKCKQYSYENAVKQVWGYLGFMLQQNLYEAAITADQLRSFSLDDGCESGACKL